MDELVTITIQIGFLLCGDLKPVRAMHVPSPKSQETYLSRGNTWRGIEEKKFLRSYFLKWQDL